MDADDQDVSLSPLYHACMANDLPLVKRLLAAGADRPTSINRWNEPPEGMASPEVAQILRARRFAP